MVKILLVLTVVLIGCNSIDENDKVLVGNYVKIVNGNDHYLPIYPSKSSVEMVIVVRHRHIFGRGEYFVLNAVGMWKDGYKLRKAYLRIKAPSYVWRNVEDGDVIRVKPHYGGVISVAVPDEYHIATTISLKKLDWIY